MRELFILRHAKSSWDDPSLADFDRPLNSRGKEDAPLMGEHLAKLGVKPDIIVSSPAKRAKKTAKIVAEQLGFNPEKIEFRETIYEASPQSLLYLVCQFPENAKRVMLVGHNPGLTELANILGDITIENIPTTGVVGIAFDTSKWEEACRMKGHTILFDFPKKIKGKE
ncbi:histidine phosphatase family protein [Hydrogenimonas thermophila]|uniref:SixA phosphatase family protein n=1 Tax=Hydrogenimonas thermophila TaxID=223786 RepID=UPI0029370EB1|nr:histidine phosphatase family protein [Hydrogenimonas thermophila]WOE70328.1 histidine phosphatase family protein [Hydrogenimonas thermophila]WOE72845.1 histidine phosphatase family protein [Hydrogenimonas thermophila]